VIREAIHLADKRGHLFAALTALGMTCSLAGHAQTVPRPWPPVPQPPLSGKTELVVGVSINGTAQPGGEHIIALTDGRLAASAEAIQHWRLSIPAIRPIPFGGENYYPLDAIPGLHYNLDSATQELKITIPPANFLSSVITGVNGMQTAPKASLGGFFNYDVLAEHDSFTQAGVQTTGTLGTLSTTQSSRSGSGLFETGLFDSWGVGTSTFLWQNPIPAGTPRHVTRLETAWTYENPASMSRYQLGDNITSTGTWGRAVRFAGLQWRRDFNTQPGFITFPQPSLTGLAAVPSTVDVYVNNSKRSSEGVPVGPFQLNNVPVITGTGDVKLVVTDLLGRQQVITEHYYASQSLLRKGLSDYSFEFGGVRENYGILWDRYGQSFGEATYRYGLSDSFTGELRTEALSTQKTAGLGGVYVWPAVGTFTAAVAGSHESDGDGRMGMAGVEHISQTVTWSVQDLVGSPRFTELGWVTDAPGVTGATALTSLPGLPVATNLPAYRPHRIQSLLVGVPVLGLGGMLSFSNVNQTFYGQAGTRVLSLNYSRELPGAFFFTIYGSRSRTTGATPNFFAGFMLSKSLSSNTSASLQTNRQNAGSDHILQVQKNLPSGPGTGYLLLGDQGLNKRQEADGYWQTSVGTFTAGASHAANLTTTRLGATGGIAFLGGSAFLSRYIYNSFAVVDAGGYPDVRVYYENRLAGRTGSDGKLLIPQLLPYQPNRISVNPSDLPIEAQINNPEVMVTPALRSGAYVKFPVKTVHGGTLTIVLDDGSYLPVGSYVVIHNQPEKYPVGRDGKVFLPSLTRRNELFAAWNHQACEITVYVPANSPPLADLGRYVCRGVKP
jgi:outer membrane usher protein